MPGEALVVFTFKSIDTLLHHSGTGSWRLDPVRARRCRYVVCTRNAKDARREGPEPHHAGFLVGKVIDVVPAPQEVADYIVEFSEYALINKRGVWRGDRNPVRYANVEDMGIDFERLDWQPMPPRQPGSAKATEASAVPTFGASGVRPPAILAEAKAGETTPMTNGLPDKVRYIKNGAGGGWWKAARTNGQVHIGWSDMPGEVLASGDLENLAAELRSRRYANGKRGFKQDLNQLLAVLVHPSQYLWITFQDGCMWWCTVRDGITLNPDGESAGRGHFWLTCDRPWSNQSLGDRELAVGTLSGRITRTAGFQGTLCEPVGSEEILRVIHDGDDAEVTAADIARRAYEEAILQLVRRLHPKDFELLVDLILSRTGWARVAANVSTMNMAIAPAKVTANCA